MDLSQEEIEYQAAREQRRLELNARIDLGQGYRKEYDAAVKKFRKEQDAEEARRKKWEEKAKTLREAKVKAHSGIRMASEADSLLVDEFVPKEVRQTRDKTHAAMARAARLLENEEQNLRTLYQIRDKKDIKHHEVVDRDPRTREPRKTITGKTKRKKVPNPNAWASKQEREFHEEKIEAQKVKVEEARVAAERAEKAYNVAEAEFSKHYEEARKSG